MQAAVDELMGAEPCIQDVILSVLEIRDHG